MSTSKDKNVRRFLPRNFKPPIVRKKGDGIAAFHAYDWYFRKMKKYLADIERVFLTPCAATKPICYSMLHRGIYQKFITAFGAEHEVLVVSEPVVLILYRDLYVDFGINRVTDQVFGYDFPPRLLDEHARTLFVGRLRELLRGKTIVGCLPHHHASLIDDAVGSSWKNYWEGDLYEMMRQASLLHPDLDVDGRHHCHSVYKGDQFNRIIGLRVSGLVYDHRYIMRSV